MATASAISSTAHVAAPAVTAETIPPLAAGDRLSRAEFMRRYIMMTDLKKAELIEGVVYTPSPVRMDVHASPQADLLTWLGVYRAMTPGVSAGDNATLELDNDNAPQPDAILMIHAQMGGQAKISTQGYIQGAPELVAEVAVSTVSYDLHDKLRAYRRNGVQEYLVWRVFDRAVDWFALRDSEYVLLAADGEGTVRSGVFPGLWLNVPALLDGKLDVVLATLQTGLASPEHREFVAGLAKQGTQGGSAATSQPGPGQS